MKSILIFILLLALSCSSIAEYRAFMLHLVNSKTNVTRLIQTTLDPEQFQTQYPLAPNEKLTYVQTWRCKGRTDNFQPICNKPDRNPAQTSQSLETKK